MKKPGRMKFLLLFLILLLNSCGTETPETITTVVVGITSDVESLNPLFSFSGYETVLTELLYPALVQYEWNDGDGEMEFYPMLAEKWEWSEDSSSVIFYLRKDLTWSDGKSVTANDVIFSYDVYSDPAVQSRLYGAFDIFYIDEDLRIDINRSFESDDPYILKMNFSGNVSPQMKDFDRPLIPQHIFSRFDRSTLANNEKGIDSVTCGAFYLSRWDKNQSLVFKRRSQPYLNDPGNIKEIIFKIIPDYNSRLTQLRRGEIDLMEDIKFDDVRGLKSLENLAVDEIEGKEYDYIGWNNIDPAVYSASGKFVPHPLFGSSEIRQALTYAINREEIFTEYLQSYGSLASGPVSPIFSNAFNSNIVPHEYNPQKAIDILNQQGWIDHNNDGIVEKEGQKFSFTLNIPSGNPRREFASVLIKNNLKGAGIDVTVEALEPGVFFDRMFSKQLDAWMAGWVIPVPLDLNLYWHSDLDNAPLNVVSYRSSRTDKLLNNIAKEKDEDKKNEYIKELQVVFYEENPVTFLYWIDNLIAYNRRLDNIKVTPLGIFHQCWKWSVK
jgi:peptide/nickel transport system substrate-binding protein